MTINWKTLLTQLSEPFAKEDIFWRAGRRSNDGKRAQALAYAEPRDLRRPPKRNLPW